jgi:hypothetical protein
MIPTQPAPTTAEQSAHLAPRFPRFRRSRALLALCAVLIVVNAWTVGLLVSGAGDEATGCVWVTGEGR